MPSRRYPFADHWLQKRRQPLGMTQAAASITQSVAGLRVVHCLHDTNWQPPDE